MGDLKEFGGALYFGSMHPPGTALQGFIGTYGEPSTPEELELAEQNTTRAFVIIKAYDFDNRRSGPKFKLLYGDNQLPVFTPSSDPSSPTLGTWNVENSKMGPAAYGGSGFGDVNNFYAWTMQYFGNQLCVGTASLTDPDLWCFPNPNSAAVPLTTTGFPEAAGALGFRTMVAVSNALYIGTSTISNLGPTQGWKLLRLE